MNHFTFTILIFLISGMSGLNAALAGNLQDEPPRGHLWGYIFGDLYWKVAGENAEWGQAEYMQTDKNMFAGKLRRLYFGYNYRMSDQFSSSLLLEANPGTLMPNGAYGTIIKQGYLQWNIPYNLLYNPSVRVGLIPTPVFAFPERTWGYRSIEKEILDSRGIGQSVDQGVSYSANFDRAGNYGVTLMAGNGSGTRPAGDSHLEYYTSFFARLFDRRFSVEVMTDYKYLGDGNNFGIVRGFFAWEAENWMLGAEIAQNYNSVSGNSGHTDIEPLLISLFSSITLHGISDKLRAFVRYDLFNPDRDYSDDKVYPDNFPDDLQYVYDQHLLIAGLHFAPHERVHIKPNVYINRYDDKRPDPVNRKTDIVPRTTLYFLF